jgi:hypothetical protein
MLSTSLYFTLLVVLVTVDAARLAGECARICNDLRRDVLSREICRSLLLFKKIRKKHIHFFPLFLEIKIEIKSIYLLFLFLYKHYYNITYKIKQNLNFRDSKKILPRPKVGDFCDMGMEQGYSDACVAICMEVYFFLVIYHFFIINIFFIHTYTHTQNQIKSNQINKTTTKTTKKRKK